MVDVPPNQTNNSASMQNPLMCQASGQLNGAFSIGHVQYFCNSRKPLSSLLRLELGLLESKVYQVNNGLLGWPKGIIEILFPRKM